MTATRKPPSQRLLTLTDTDDLLLDLIQRTGGVTMSQAHRYLRSGATREAMYMRIGRLVRAGLIRNEPVLAKQPGLYVPASAGEVSPATYLHRLGVADLFIDALHEIQGGGTPIREVVSETEIRRADYAPASGRRSVPVYSVPVYSGPVPVGGYAGGPVHSPDLSLVLDRPETGPVRQIAVEYERTVKQRSRIADTVRAYDLAATRGTVPMVRWFFSDQAIARHYIEVIGEVSVHGAKVHKGFLLTPRWAWPKGQVLAA